MLNRERLRQIKMSALWAAYGDALGFITELADKQGVKHRTGKSRIETTIPWKRRIGGKFGVVVDLPAGCYSDDTQLRLATCRAIRGDGKFDVEAFAKIELPVWLSYSLGAGRGSKAAAASLSKRNISWTNNFFKIKNSRYIDGGGNGAAMRIQPHVWASADQSNSKTFLPDVIRNTICTHGHTRGILGAVFHALCLAYTMHKKAVPGPKEWKNFVGQFYTIYDLICSDSELKDYWLLAWEKAKGKSLEKELNEVASECLQDIEKAELLVNESQSQQYANLVKNAGGLDQYCGTGTKTAIFAAFLAWIYKDDPQEAMVSCANLLGSDTDTIATMGGAILGTIATSPPPGKICDQNYIEEEASRLYSISQKVGSESFSYPDLLRWIAPSVQSDFVGTAKGRIAVSGLGYAKEAGDSYQQQGKGDAIWQWLQLDYGQKILAKRRSKQISVPLTNIPLQTAVQSNTRFGSNAGVQETLFSSTVEKKTRQKNSKNNMLTMDEALEQIIVSGFDQSLIGRILLDFAECESGVELAIGFSAIVAKARRARLEKEKQQKLKA